MKKAKDKQTVNLLWQSYEAYMRKICEYKLKSLPDCIDDCVQDIFLDFCNEIENGKK